MNARGGGLGGKGRGPKYATASHHIHTTPWPCDNRHTQLKPLVEHLANWRL